MSEVFAWPEAMLYLYTGSHTASGNPLGYVTNVNINQQVAWQSNAAVDGTYRAHITDERVDYSFQVGWLYGEAITVLHAAQTAVHAKLVATMPTLGSAGIMIYSGVLPNLAINGAEGGVFNQNVNGFAHSWSAF